jgi:hypothetical protein
MYTVEAEDLNKLYASHRLTVTADTGSDDFVKAKKYVISYLRTLRNKNNDDCVTITGNEQLDGGWDWLWIVTPLDTEACNFLSAKLQEMRSHDSGEPEWVNEDEPGWVHEDSFCYIVFNAAKKSNTKFHLKFENGQRNIKNYGKGANNKIIIEKILSLEAENAETIESGAFVNGVSLRKIYLPKVKKLGDGVFIKCTNLEEINLPNAEKIGETGDVKEDIFGVFRNCEKLHEVILPKARMIGNRTFAGCHSLEELILLKAETIEALAFVIFDFKDNELIFRT